MNDRHLCKAKRTDNGEWVEGFYFCMIHDDGRHAHHFVLPLGADLNLGTPIEKIQVEVDPSTICQCVEKEYMDSTIAYEGDIFESQVSGDLMILRFGTYQAYCPVDRKYMDSVGFYAECKAYPDMPIGDLHDYALKKGNIFDNPELLEGDARSVTKNIDIETNAIIDAKIGENYAESIREDY